MDRIQSVTGTSRIKLSSPIHWKRFLPLPDPRWTSDGTLFVGHDIRKEITALKLRFYQLFLRFCFCLKFEIVELRTPEAWLSVLRE